MSYSCGKDSALALHRMVAAGHEPSGLLVMINKDMGRSWFHGVDATLLSNISLSLKIPLIPCVCSGEQYHSALEEGLRKAMDKGAECCVFGDIDIEEHFDWCAQRCESVGLRYNFPLWREDREKLTRELIALGYVAVIKCVNKKYLPAPLLGRALNEDIIARIKTAGADVCGENGEYHTVALDGPAFSFPVKYRLGEVVEFGDIAAIDITAEEDDV